MSFFQPTLYGTYEYAKNSSGATSNLYGNSFITQSSTLTFNETISEADSFVNDSIKALVETMTLFDMVSKNVVRDLSDMVTPADVKAFIISKVLADSVNVGDSQAALHLIKSLNDILLVQDWISIRLQKAQIWTSGVVTSNSKPSLYGQIKYGTSLYAGDGLLFWIEVKPTVPNTNGWKSFNQLESMN